MKRIRRLVMASVLLIGVLLLSGTAVFASSSDITIRFGITAPLDACPNIPGIQPSVPDGMSVDTDGNCYTPAPPQPVIDLCLNIPGVQAVIPGGYYRTSDGNCYRQPTPPEPPVSVCPNLPGMHLTVPDGYYLDTETNECLEIVAPAPPVSDVCLNIPGIQATTPSGMVNNDGYCHTPIAPPGGSVTPEPRPPLSNVPEFLQPIMQGLVGAVPEPMQRFFRDLPDDVVNRLPLYIMILVLILILIPIPQSIREYFYRKKLMAFYKREQRIAEEKNNFITIASHYLRTPMAIMKDSLLLMSSAGEISQANAIAMNGALATLGGQITAGLEVANANNAPFGAQPAKPAPFWRSTFFWLPIALSIVLTFLVNFFIGIVGDKTIGMNNMFFQIFIIIVFVVLLYLIVRNYHIQKKLRQEKDDLIAHEQAIDAARNNFLDQQATNISSALGALYFASAASPPSRSYALYTDGISRLSSLHDKFILLSQIKTGVNRTASTFSLKTAIDRAIAARQSDIAAKNLSVQNTVSDVLLTQNEPLFSFVISSTLDNAIKFANPGGRVFVASRPDDKVVMVRVSDNGRGIDPTKIGQLFKPFSRAESAVDFSYEGLGLSLFLNRLILTYTGGDISVVPRTTGGTDVTITTPTNIMEGGVDEKMSARDYASHAVGAFAGA